MPTRSSCCWKRCLQSMASPKSFTLTMAHNMWVPSLPTFCISWGITHETSSPHYLQSNRFVEACVKSIKHALQWAKYSSADPQLTLLALQATPIDTKLPSPAELLYQCQLRTTILVKIYNNNPTAIQVHEQIDTCSEVAKSEADKCSKTLALLYAGQPVAMYDTSERFGFLLLWYMSYHGTAIKYAPAMVPHTATCGDTFVNAVSKQLTLSQVAQLPHSRLWLDTTSQQHNLH